jgi:predicted dehydrogenase
MRGVASATGASMRHARPAKMAASWIAERRMRTVFGIVMAVIAGGTQAQALPPPDPFSPERNAAIGYAITMDLTTHTLDRSCAPFGGAAADAVRAARRGWQRRNAALVDTAHRHLALQRDLVTQRDGADAGRRYYDERKATLQQGTQGSLRDMFPPGADAIGTCRRIAGELDAGGFDIESQAQHASVLKTMLAELPPRD